MIFIWFQQNTINVLNEEGYNFSKILLSIDIRADSILEKDYKLHIVGNKESKLTYSEASKLI